MDSKKVEKRGTSERVFSELYIYTYWDIKSKTYDVPWFAKDDVNAKRKFQLDIAAREGQTVLGMFHDNFELYHIGKFNVQTGILIQTKPELIASGKEITRKEK